MGISKIITIPALVFFCTLFSTAYADTIYEEGFEEGGVFTSSGNGLFYNELKCHGSHGNCPDISSEQSKDGSLSMSFGLQYEEGENRYREEVYAKKGEYENGKEYWFSFDYRYENWKNDSNGEIAPFQVHTRPSTWGEIDGVRCALGAAVSTAPLLMTSVAGKVQFKTYGGNILWTAPIEKNKWLNMKVHFRVSTDNDGFVEAWYNGQHIGRFEGPTGPKLDKCGKPMRDPYLNFGVYKWDWKADRAATDSTERQLYIDNIRLGTGAIDGGSTTGENADSGTDSDNGTATDNDNETDIEQNADFEQGAALDARFGSAIVNSYGEDFEWDSGWELRWLDFNFSENKVVRLFHATNRQDPSIRYTIFNDPETGEWVGWTKL
ncbi:MAG: heparin lyase I family protein [Granulosicoccus sp.]